MSSPEPDPGSVMVPLAEVTVIAQELVRNARPSDRARLWANWESARQHEVEREIASAAHGLMPWDKPDQVTMIPGSAVVAALTTTLCRTYRDAAERVRLVKAVTPLVDMLGTESFPVSPDNAQAAPAHPGRPLCRWCARPIPPTRRADSLYCQDSHRTAAFRARKRSVGR